jgi:DNA-binding response OmpR family regulator
VSLVRLGESTVDLSTGAVTGGPEGLILSDRERGLLRQLVDAAGALISREELGGGRGSRAADMAVSRLRKRLGPAGASIMTVRGRGYRLDVATDEPAIDLGWGRLHLPSLRVELPDRAVGITQQQATLLARLSEQAGRPVGRQELARALWGVEASGQRLDLLVHRLRNRLEADAARPRFLVTVRGRGLSILDARPARRGVEGVQRLVELVGRSAEIAQACGLLDSVARRALIHGPPGVGKSAVAISAAATWAAGERGAVAVDLHGVETTDEAELRLAAALRMDSARDDGVLGRAFVARGDFVLLLDGALPDGLAPRIEAWQTSAPALRVLVAARAAPAGWPLVELSGLQGPDAIDLLERSAGKPLGDDAARLVQRLEGNPLALELVGRGLKRADVDAIDRRLALPLTPLRHAWQAALAQLPDGSHDAALALSLFRRPFDGEDAAVVANLSEDSEGVVETLLALSVLQARPGDRMALPHAARELLAAELRRSGGFRDARRRLRGRCLHVLKRIAGSIPEQGGAALDELVLRWVDLDPALPPGDDLDSDQARLLSQLAREAGERVPRERREGWANDLAIAADRTGLDAAARAACLQGVHALRWDHQSRAERTGLLRAALLLAVQGGDDVLAAALAGELASVVAFSYGARDARALLREHRMPADAPLDERVRRLRHEGRLAMFDDQPRAGLPLLTDAVHLAEEGGLPLLEARCRIALGQALSRTTHGQEAEHHLRRAIAITAEHALPEQNVRASIRLSQHLLLLGLRAEAAALLEDAHNAALRAGLVRLEEQCVATLGFVLVGQGRSVDALVHLDRALELAEGHGARRALYVALVNRGLARAFSGDPASGRVDLARGLELSKNPGWFRAVGLSYRAVVELLDGDSDAAQGTVAEADRLLATLSTPDAPAMAEALAALATFAGGGAADVATTFLSDASGGAEVEAVLDGLRQAVVGQ